MSSAGMSARSIQQLERRRISFFIKLLLQAGLDGIDSCHFSSHPNIQIKLNQPLPHEPHNPASRPLPSSSHLLKFFRKEVPLPYIYAKIYPDFFTIPANFLFKV